MSKFLGVCAVVCVLLSIGTCSVAKGAVHEIAALIWLLTGAVLLVGAAIVGLLERAARSAGTAPK